VYAPIAGEVVAANTAVTTAPESLNADAYAAWLFRIKPDDPSALAGMLDAAAYEKLIA
jgi:glycine cleavage system H protein